MGLVLWTLPESLCRVHVIFGLPEILSIAEEGSLGRKGHQDAYLSVSKNQGHLIWTQ